MKRRFFSSDFFLIVLVLAFFVSGIVFVVYEPDNNEGKKLKQVSVDSPVDNVKSGDKSNSQNKSKVVVAESGDSNKAKVDPTLSSPGKVKVDEVPPEMAGAAPGAADFGIEGVVFSLSSGLPLTGCKVSFAGHGVITDERGEFHLWLDGGVGALHFAYAGAGKVQIKNFDISAGQGLARFEVYLDDSGRAGAGRIEINGVSGRVYSRDTGAPLAGARITIGSRHGVVDAAGFFEIWGNDTDLLTMVVSAPGYVSEMISGIEFENQTNPFFYEISLNRESAGNGRRHLALVGIGARLIESESGYEITELLADSPAAREGLIPGDRLVAVDNLAVDDFSLREVVELIRGQASQPVTLLFERNGNFLEFTCIRQRDVY